MYIAYQKQAHPLMSCYDIHYNINTTHPSNARLHTYIQANSYKLSLTRVGHLNKFACVFVVVQFN